MHQKFVASIMRDHRAWRKINYEHIYNRELVYLERSLNEKRVHVRARKVGLLCLRGLGLCSSISGLVRVFDGDVDGWDEISLGIEYMHREIALEYTACCLDPYGENSWFDNHVSRAACLACAGHVHGVARWSRLAEMILARIFDRSLRVNPPFVEGRIFEPFVLNVCRLRDGQPAVMPTVSSSNPYSDVLAVWNDPTRLSTAMTKICDYHCEHADDTDDNYSEFMCVPFDVLPVEVQFVTSVRQQLGLETPSAPHPLCDSPFAATGHIHTVKHPILSRIDAEFSSVFESVGLTAS